MMKGIFGCINHARYCNIATAVLPDTALKLKKTNHDSSIILITEVVKVNRKILLEERFIYVMLCHL